MSEQSYAINTLVTTPSWLALRYSKESIRELGLAMATSKVINEEAVGSTWGVGESYFHGENFYIEIKGIVYAKANDETDIKFVLDRESTSLADIDGFDNVSDEAFENLILAFKHDKPKIRPAQF